MSSKEQTTNPNGQDATQQQHSTSTGTERVSTALLPDVCRVGIKVPPFWPEKPAIWFAQIEGQFAICNIKVDETKYYYVMAHLAPQYAAEVEDIITSPPANNKYEKLKTELIKRLSDSKDKKVQQLLSHEVLGDRKPSQFLRQLKSLAGHDIPEDFLRVIWTSRLPSNTQAIIAAHADTTLEQLADMADKINDVTPGYPQVASTSSNTGSSLDKMAEQIAELTEQVQALTTQRQGRPRSTSQNLRLDRSESRKRFPTCWFHYKFGNKARRCQKPCDFQSENFQGGR